MNNKKEDGKSKCNGKHDSFSICTLNLKNYLQPPNAFYEIDNIYTDIQWAAKQDWIASQLIASSPDIVAFQEVFSLDALRDLMLSLGYEYFVTVDTPEVDLFIYSHPVVALASRFPIKTVRGIAVESECIEEYPLPKDFAFSRVPLCAEVFIEGLGSCFIYVVHFKSQRQNRDFTNNPLEPHVVAKKCVFMSEAAWGATMQRGTEAALVYRDIITNMQNNDLPVIVLGDFNDSLESSAVKHIMGEKSDISCPHQFSLYDAFNLYDETERKFTHYHLNQGKILDYVLLSKDFNINYHYNLACVTGYHVLDKHLINPNYQVDSQCSDHAPVVVDIDIRT